MHQCIKLIYFRTTLYVYLFDSCMYSLVPLMMDGKTVRNV